MVASHCLFLIINNVEYFLILYYLGCAAYVYVLLAGDLFTYPWVLRVHYLSFMSVARHIIHFVFWNRVLGTSPQTSFLDSASRCCIPSVHSQIHLFPTLGRRLWLFLPITDFNFDEVRFLASHGSALSTFWVAGTADVCHLTNEHSTLARCCLFYCAFPSLSQSGSSMVLSSFRIHLSVSLKDCARTWMEFALNPEMIC